MLKRYGNDVYVDFKIAKLLKELGFDWECPCHWVDGSKGDTALLIPKKHFFYGNVYGDIIRADEDWNHSKQYEENLYQVYSAPSLSIVQRWLREVKSIHIVTNLNDVNDITYKSTIYELIVDKNTELFIPGILKPLHFCPNNLFFRGETHEYENPDRALYDAIKLALIYLKTGKPKYVKHYQKYLEK